MVAQIKKLTKLKLILEISINNFPFSTIGYGFRKSELFTQLNVDDIYLAIEDAANYTSVPKKLIEEAKKYFKGITSTGQVGEFPE